MKLYLILQCNLKLNIMKENLKELHYLLGIALNDIKTLDAFVNNGTEDVPYHVKNKDSYKELNRSRIEKHSIGFKDNFKELISVLKNTKITERDLDSYIAECLNKLK